jgi:hypothetical protein
MQPVQCLLLFEYFVLLASDNETRWLLDVDLLLQVTVQEHQFKVHMVHRVQPRHWHEDFIVVDAMSLRVALHHKACLVLGHHARACPASP